MSLSDFLWDEGFRKPGDKLLQSLAQELQNYPDCIDQKQLQRGIRSEVGADSNSHGGAVLPLVLGARPCKRAVNRILACFAGCGIRRRAGSGR